MNIKNFMYKTLPEYTVKHNDAFLIGSNALTFTVSAGAQAYSVLNNKKLPEEDRRLIFKQEIIKGVLDFCFFIALAIGFKNFGQALVKHGKFLPKELPGVTGKENIRKTIKEFMAAHSAKLPIPENINPRQEDAILAHLAGAKLWTSFLGTALSFNLITPVLKNYFADIASRKLENKQSRKNHAPNVVMPAQRLENNQGLISKLNEFKMQLDSGV